MDPNTLPSPRPSPMLNPKPEFPPASSLDRSASKTVLLRFARSAAWSRRWMTAGSYSGFASTRPSWSSMPRAADTPAASFDLGRESCCTSSGRTPCHHRFTSHRTMKSCTGCESAFSAKLKSSTSLKMVSSRRSARIAARRPRCAAAPLHSFRLGFGTGRILSESISSAPPPARRPARSASPMAKGGRTAQRKGWYISDVVYFSA
eukprot:scaffold1954_cov268-Pinguiococcus_pyrenoidosus.AAC.185